jgi:predicted Fe-Mo cluster-binding NifX family protein
MSERIKKRIAVASGDKGLDDDVCPVFGRCMKYTLAECEGVDIMEARVVDNPGFSSGGGAGIQAAQYIAGEGVNAVISGNFGPNSAAVLRQAGVDMIQARGKVADAIRKHLNGELKPVNSPTVDDHFGRCRRGRGRL